MLTFFDYPLPFIAIGILKEPIFPMEKYFSLAEPFNGCPPCFPQHF
jgi:hypothetical protein